MYYKQVEDSGNSRSMIDTWLGYNHNYKINSGEFYNMENLTTDNFPLMSPRAIRPLLVDEENIHGMIYTDNNVVYLKGTKLCTVVQEYDLSDYMEEPEEWQTLLRFGAYILIYPANVYVNMYEPSDKGSMTSRYTTETGDTVTYTVCNAEGDGYEHITASDEAPSNPNNGDYWICTGTNKGLYIYNKDTWEAVATSHIRIEVSRGNLMSHFNEGDTIMMNTQLDDVNDGSIIRKITDEYFVIEGIMDEPTRTETVTESWKLLIERKLPKLDYVCVDKNRIWGCHYGYVNGEMVNEIYASKLGDFKNFYSFAGSAADSYSVTVGVAGEWTGCISYQGYPTFFKENAIFRIFGSYPAQYQINQSDQRGVQQGSYRSLAIVDELLVYKSATDICAYDGAVPVSISEELGRSQIYYDAVGGGCQSKYRIVMQNALTKRFYFVYDFKHRLWTKEDAIPIEAFSATENGQIYGATKDKIYGLGSTDNVVFSKKLVSEEWVSWFAETGEMGFETPDYKYINKLTVRAFVPSRSELAVQISYDNRPFDDIGVIRGDSNIGTQALAFAPYRCDHFRIRFSGHGDSRIYSLAITYETGSDEYGY